MAIPSRYRYIKFYGGKILDSSNLIDMERQIAGLDEAATTKTVYDLSAIYREGALFNATFTISGTNVNISAIDGSLPVLVFVRGRWEPFLSSEISSPISMTGGGNLYLNWALRQVTSIEDPSLVDATTGESTIDMGELDLSVSSTDTSGSSLGSNQFEKNRSTILLANFSISGSTLSINYTNNIKTQALSNNHNGGLVTLTTSTSNGIAVSTDDPRMSDTRSPSTGSVVDSSVRTPSPNGNTNIDGTVQYDLGTDIGGINSDKIIYQESKQTVGAALSWIKSQLASALTSLSNHIGQRLGLSNTHPMPNASDVGAAPISHVNMSLGIAGSHPAVVSTNSGGFSVNRNSTVVPSSNDPAFQVNSSGTTKNALFHDGDIYSSTGDSIISSPGGSGITASGPLNIWSVLATVLAQHVNQNSHGNPHGLTAGDIGAASTGYVDSAVANILAQAETYSNVILVQAETYANSLISVNNDPANSRCTITLGGGAILINLGQVNGRTRGSFIPFLTGFPNACYGVMASDSSTGGTNPYIMSGEFINTSGFTLQVNSGATVNSFYIAIGY